MGHVQFTSEWFRDYERRQAAKKGALVVSGKGVEQESDLHDEIIKECARRGWIPFHSRMDRPQTGNVGTPDFIIATDDGRTLYVECKRRKGKLTIAQQATLHWLLANKQIAFVVTSLDEFLRLVK